MLAWWCLITSTTLCYAGTEIGKIDKPKFSVALIMYFDSDYSNPSLGWMQTELGEILKPAGISIETRFSRDVRPGDAFERLAVIHFKGSCSMNREFRYVDRGPFGMVQRIDGEILPFIDVYCDRIHQRVREDLRGQTESERIRKFGRAIARVIAHELYHVFSQSARHAKSGINKFGYTADDLLCERLELDSESIQLMVNSPTAVREKRSANRVKHSFDNTQNRKAFRQ
jgi:hypothetical protein